MNADPDIVAIGIAGHLGLDADARARVSAAAALWFRQRVLAAGWTRVRLLCGLAPGADVVLAEALLQAGPGLGVRVELQALMVAEPETLLAAWQQRAAELGTPPSTQAQQRVRQRIDALLQRASQVESLGAADGSPGFQRLAARLALVPDELVCVLRPGHAGKPGGAAELVAWRREPDAIPAALRAGADLCSSRAMLIIDPDTGEARYSRA